MEGIIIPKTSCWKVGLYSELRNQLRLLGDKKILHATGSRHYESLRAVSLRTRRLANRNREFFDVGGVRRGSLVENLAQMNLEAQPEAPQPRSDSEDAGENNDSDFDSGSDFETISEDERGDDEMVSVPDRITVPGGEIVREDNIPDGNENMIGIEESVAI